MVLKSSVEFRLYTMRYIFILQQKVVRRTQPKSYDTIARIVLRTTQTAPIAQLTGVQNSEPMTKARADYGSYYVISAIHVEMTAHCTLYLLWSVRMVVRMYQLML